MPYMPAMTAEEKAWRPDPKKPGPPLYMPFKTCKGEGLHCARGIFNQMSSSSYKQVNISK